MKAKGSIAFPDETRGPASVDEYQIVCPACSGDLHLVSVGINCDIPLYKDGFSLVDGGVDTYGETCRCQWCGYMISPLPMGPWLLKISVTKYGDTHHKLVVVAKCETWEGPVATYDIEGPMTSSMARRIARAIGETQGTLIEAVQGFLKVSYVDYSDIKR